jgi:hypothetical protein
MAGTELMKCSSSGFSCFCICENKTEKKEIRTNKKRDANESHVHDQSVNYVDVSTCETRGEHERIDEIPFVDLSDIVDMNRHTHAHTHTRVIHDDEFVVVVHIEKRIFANALRNSKLKIV